MCHGNQSLKMPKAMKVMEVVWNIRLGLGLRHWSEKNDPWYQKRAIWHGWRLKQRKVGEGGQEQMGRLEPPHRAESLAAGVDESRRLTMTSCVRLHPSEQRNVPCKFRPTSPWNSRRNGNTAQPCLVSSMERVGGRRAGPFYQVFILFHSPLEGSREGEGASLVAQW